MRISSSVNSFFGSLLLVLDIFKLIKSRILTFQFSAIQHRLDNIKNFDSIMVLDSGEIAEFGTFDRLMESKGKIVQYQPCTIIL